MQTQKAPTYLKAITLRDTSDIHGIKEDIKKNMILVLRVTPLAQKNVDELKKVVEEISRRLNRGWISWPEAPVNL